MTGPRKDLRQFLVKWKGHDEGHNTWEFELDLLEDAPEKAKQLIQEYWSRSQKRKKEKRSQAKK